MRPEDQSRPERQPLLYRALGLVERVGNVLPHPATLFVILSVLVILVSAVAASVGMSVTHPNTGETIPAVSLLSVAGLHRILTNLVTNFTGFAPLGTVLVSLLGIAVAEGSGLISALMRLFVLSAPQRLLTAAIVFAGVMSNIATDVGYVLIIPLGAMIFLAIGRHPLAGLAAAFAGVSGGFSANLLITPLDPLLGGLTQEPARIINATYEVSAAANYYFIVVSTFLVTIVGTIVTEKIVVPRLGAYAGEEKPEKIEPLSPQEKRGLWFALFATLLFTAFLLLGTVPANGFLRHPETGAILQSPFLSGIVAIIFFAGVLIGLAYGIGAKTIRNDLDVMRSMEKAMETMAVYIVLAFFAAQFINFFNWTNLGLITAVRGAEGLRALSLGGAPLMISFVVITMLLNLLMASASAKWALMAPVFVPMFMLLGYSPELTQMSYRVGDSVTNIITPLNAYFPLIVAFAKRYDKDAGIGTVVATMLPYTVAFFIGWTLLLIVWFELGWPLGPDAPLYYQSGR